MKRRSIKTNQFYYIIIAFISFIFSFLSLYAYLKQLAYFYFIHSTSFFLFLSLIVNYVSNKKLVTYIINQLAFLLGWIAGMGLFQLTGHIHFTMNQYIQFGYLGIICFILMFLYYFMSLDEFSYYLMIMFILIYFLSLGINIDMNHLGMIDFTNLVLGLILLVIHVQNVKKACMLIGFSLLILFCFQNYTWLKNLSLLKKLN